jgi:glycosyltransferase involved in cell wall biosynthesis
MSKKRLLYISCHEVLEHDELRIFHELGFDVFSIGYWMNPHKPTTNMRPAIPELSVNQELIDKFNRDYPEYKPPKAEFMTGRVALRKDFLDNFDVIVSCWYPDNLTHILKNAGDKPVIHRTIDIINSRVEDYITGLYMRARPFFMVRMSEMEVIQLKPAIKCQAIIRQCVEIDKYKGWVGTEKQVFTNIKAMKKRPDILDDIYEIVTSNHKRVLVGAENEGIPYAKCSVPEDEFISLMQKSRVNYVQPRLGAAITYSFMEALSCGCPIVTLGTKFNGPNWEAGFFIKNGLNGFCVNTIDEAISYIDLLMKDDNLAHSISQKARKTAIDNFNYPVAKEGWAKLMKETGVQ